MRMARVWKAIVGVLISVGTVIGLSRDASAHNPAFTRTFKLNTCNGFMATGRNPYFVLEPGYRLVLEGTEDGETVVTPSQAGVRGSGRVGRCAIERSPARPEADV